MPRSTLDRGVVWSSAFEGAPVEVVAVGGGDGFGVGDYLMAAELPRSQDLRATNQMPDPVRPSVDCEFHHTGVPVDDVRSAVSFYTEKLGFELGFTWGEPPTMAGVNLGEAQIFLEEGTPNPRGCNLYFVVGDADELFEFQRARGVEVISMPGDREYGLRDYSVSDLHGYRLSFGHYIYTVGDPVPIERVDVPVRLERRLAALLQDLAVHKRMTLASCLEEILLHTNDGVGPHTKSTLRHIEELKRKHGIDYDSHASYRFEEK